MKSNYEEQQERILRYLEISEKYGEWRTKILQESDEEKRKKLLEDPKYLDLKEKMYNSPIVIIWREDFEDPNYRLAFGNHPSSIKTLKFLYDEGFYGATVEMDGWESPKRCIALAYDYKDFYYVIEDCDNLGKYEYYSVLTPIKIKDNGKIK